MLVDHLPLAADVPEHPGVARMRARSNADTAGRLQQPDPLASSGLGWGDFGAAHQLIAPVRQAAVPSGSFRSTP
jgi:hypothetical protein